MSRTIVLDEIGDLHAEPGSRKWALAVKGEIELALSDLKFSGEQLGAWLRMMEHRQGYRALGFASLDEFCVAPAPRGLGRPRPQIDEEIGLRLQAQRQAELAQPLQEHGGAYTKTGGRGNKLHYNCNVVSPQKGNSASYLTARIARDRPDVLERMKAGAYRSVRAAAIDAGIVKDEKRLSVPYDPARAARALRRAFTPAQVAQLIKELQDADTDA